MPHPAFTLMWVSVGELTDLGWLADGSVDFAFSSKHLGPNAQKSFSSALSPPAGALSFHHSRWLSARKNFLFPATALSLVFRGKFIDLLKQNIDRGKIPAANSRLHATGYAGA